MTDNKQPTAKELERQKRENTEIVFEKHKTKNIKELKTLEELMREKP